MGQLIVPPSGAVYLDADAIVYAMVSSRRFLTASREMQLLPISRPILERALKLRAAHRVRTPDAIHAATALIAGCTLFATNDPVFHRVSGLPAVILDDSV